jgi:hypothetical protein
MTRKLSIAAAIVLLGATSALAQTTATPTAAKNMVEPTSTTVATDAQGRALIGAPLSYNSGAGTAGIDDEAETVFVIEGGTVKGSGEWTAADRKACKDAGGIELPISAGRVACFRI